MNSRDKRQGTLTKNLRNISPVFGREAPDADLLARAQATFGPYVKKIDGKKVCPPGCQPIVPSSPSRSMPEPTLLTTQLPQGLPSPLEPTSTARSPANPVRRRGRFTVRATPQGGRSRKKRKIRHQKSKKIKKRRTKKYRKLP